MSVKLVLQVEWYKTFQTHHDPFAKKKFSNLGLEILAEWIAPNVRTFQNCDMNMFETLTELDLIKY